MTRYTEKKLADDVDNFNSWLRDCGSLKRIRHSPRNGYHAIVEYSVDDKGLRIVNLDGVNLDIQCGTPRECYQSASQFYSDEYSALHRSSGLKAIKFMADIRESFPGLVDGETDVCGSDLVEWMTSRLP